MKSRKTQRHDWFKVRRYAHFDAPIGVEAAERLVADPAKVAKHAFLPFLHFVKQVKRYKVSKKKVVAKDRPIAYAAHKDAAILSYYAYCLSVAYEKILEGYSLSDDVLAYRKFDPPKSNIQMARDSFTLIQDSRLDVAIGLDIEGFFDSLDHDLLKSAWCQVVGTDFLPADHFAVFKAITRYSIVGKKEALQRLGISNHRARNWQGRPLCSMLEFRERIRGGGLVIRNLRENKISNRPCGIPQGSPISAILSNIYMLPFDRAMHSFCSARGAVYRRYSDDILLLCSASQKDEILKEAHAQIQMRCLSIQDSKTMVSEFEPSSHGRLVTDRPFQYLGFMYDGKRTLIRSQSLARYYRRMKQRVRMAARDAKRYGGGSRPYRRALYARFTHLNQRRSFSGYVYRCSKLMKSPEIRAQFKGHWAKLHDLNDKLWRERQERESQIQTRDRK